MQPSAFMPHSGCASLHDTVPHRFPQQGVLPFLYNVDDKPPFGPILPKQSLNLRGRIDRHKNCVHCSARLAQQQRPQTCPTASQYDQMCARSAQIAQNVQICRARPVGDHTPSSTITDHRRVRNVPPLARKAAHLHQLPRHCVCKNDYQNCGVKNSRSCLRCSYTTPQETFEWVRGRIVHYTVQRQGVPNPTVSSSCGNRCLFVATNY